jgi:hypothetical protein
MLSAEKMHSLYDFFTDIPDPRRAQGRRHSLPTVLAIAAAVAGQTVWLRTAAAEDDRYPPVKIVLHPAAEPKPALKYRLFPDILDRKPGNAAVVYGKVRAEQETLFHDKELWEKIGNGAAKAPLADLRKEKGALRDLLTMRGGAFYYLDRAARCQYCDWQLPIGEPGQSVYAIMLPEVQEMRRFAWLLEVRARLQIADGKYDEAVRTLQTGYAMSKHVGDGPFLVQSLVGLACSSMMSDQVREFIQQPDAPNLYWALTSLPRPLVDLRPAMETEMEAVYLSLPELRDLKEKGPRSHDWRNLADWELRELDRKERTPQEWQRLVEKTTYRFCDFEPLSEQASPLAVLGLTLRNYPEVKRFLIARGHGAAEVEAMPVPKVVMLYTMAHYEELRDETFKWLNVPYAEARPGLEIADKRLKDAFAGKTEIIPLAGMLLPALTAVNNARARHERDFAVLRVFETLRLYGASHNRLPDRLSDITEVPIPADPVTGNPFVYTRSGDTARLEAPPPAGEPGESPNRFGPWRYDISFVPKGK